MTAQAVAEPFPGWDPPPGMQRVISSAWARFYRACWGLYRLSPVEYRALYLAQSGRCFICRKAKGVHPDDPKGRGGRRLGVDHNHLITGRGAVRGLLCTGSLSANTCNRLIAHYDVRMLERAVEHLKEAPAQGLLRWRDEAKPSDDAITGWLT